MQNIVLTGFMGTGKTTVGKLIAQQLDYQFVDTDAIIEQRAERSVAEIFQAQGEAAFRQMEAELAQELGQRTQLVISTGGGMLVDPANVAALSHAGEIFCLVATPEEILARLQRDSEQRRPLLEGVDPAARINEMLQQREAAYRRFPQVVTTAKSPAAVAHELLTLRGVISAARTNSTIK